MASYGKDGRSVGGVGGPLDLRPVPTNVADALFGEALRNLDSLLQRAQESARHLVECHEAELAKRRRRGDQDLDTMGPERFDTWTPQDPVFVAASASRFSPGNAVPRCEGDAPPEHMPSREQTAMDATGGEGAEAGAAHLPAPSGAVGDRTSPAVLGGNGAPAPGLDTNGCQPWGNVLVFKPRRAWQDFTDEEVRIFTPNYFPVVSLHSTANSGRGRRFRLFTVARQSGQSVFEKLMHTSHSKMVMDPNKPLRLAWNIPAILLLLYDTIFLPLQAFHIDQEPSLVPVIFFVEWLGTIFWTFDIFVSMRTGFYVGTLLEMRPHRIYIHYLQTWFAMDVVLVVMEWLSRFASMLNSASFVRAMSIFRIIRSLRLLRLAKLQSLWRKMEEQIHSGTVLLTITVVKMLFAFLISVHGITCTWYAIGDASAAGWTSYEQKSADGISFWYFASCRWTLAQINGRTDMNERRSMEERLFTCIIAVVFAVLFMAIFTSVVTATILELGALSEENSTSRRNVNEYLDAHRVSARLVLNIRRHLAAKATIQALLRDEVRERQVLSQMPEHLQYDLLHEIRSPVLKGHCFFRDMGDKAPRVLRVLCFSAVRSLVAHRCQDIFDQGNACSRMLWLERGKCLYEQFEHQPLGVEHTRTKRQRRSTRLPGAKVRGSTDSCDAPRTVMFAPTRSLSFDADIAADYGGVESSTVEWEAVWKVRAGMWVSEPALWMEWENQGQLVAEVDSSLYVIEAEELAHTLRDYKDGYSRAVLYAARFLKALKEQEELSDLMRVVLIQEANRSDLNNFNYDAACSFS